MICRYCPREIPDGRSENARYCSDRCRKRASQARVAKVSSEEYQRRLEHRTLPRRVR